jgi:hypothetical protein
MLAYYGAIGSVALYNARRALTKSIEKKLCDGGAISAKTAVTPEAATIASGEELRWMRNLVKQGKVGRTRDGRVWWKG